MLASWPQRRNRGQVKERLRQNLGRATRGTTGGFNQTFSMPLAFWPPVHNYAWVGIAKKKVDRELIRKLFFQTNNDGDKQKMNNFHCSKAVVLSRLIWTLGSLTSRLMASIEYFIILIIQLIGKKFKKTKQKQNHLTKRGSDNILHLFRFGL